MASLHIKMCLLHDVIDVYWTSIEARHGFDLYKHYSAMRFTNTLQAIVKEMGVENEETDLTVLYNTFCRQWDSMFVDKDCWNVHIFQETNQSHTNLYALLAELKRDVHKLAYHMQPHLL